MLLDDNRKIGMTLCGLGLALFTIGCFLFFDRILITMANLAFILGLGFLLGPQKTGLFFWKKKAPSGFFFGGMVIIMYGFPFIGEFRR